MSTNPSPVTGMSLVASTGPGGFALQNGTPTILTWNVPNDGQLHGVLVFGNLNITVAETGGGIQLQVTNPDASAFSASMNGGGGGIGTASLSARLQTAGPGTQVKVVQNSALTLGAAVMWCEIWAS